MKCADWRMRASSVHVMYVYNLTSLLVYCCCISIILANESSARVVIGVEDGCSGLALGGNGGNYVGYAFDYCLLVTLSTINEYRLVSEGPANVAPCLKIVSCPQ